MAATVIHHAAFGSKGNAASVAIGILLPVVRILEHVRTRLILGKVARGRPWGSNGASRSASRFFHHRQGQDLSLDGFEFGGVSLGVWRNTPEFVDFLIDARDPVLRIRGVGEKFRRIL